VIIAFNEGAVALVVFTNYNYTKQADEHLQHFHRKTILNIKIVIGEQINQLVEVCGATVSENLTSLIGPKKSNTNLFDTILKIDLSADELYHQFLYKQWDDDRECGKEFYLSSRNKGLLVSVRNFLTQGGLVAISGVIGCGKRTFCKAVTQDLNYISIRIDASLHRLQESLLLDILLTIWGIPGKDIIDDFTVDHVDVILKRLARKYPDEQILDILRHLFGDKTIKGINNEQYNIRVCEYILYILNLHHPVLPHLFYIYNLEYAPGEIRTLLIYFITRLRDHKIPCIILGNQEEYDLQGQRMLDFQTIFKPLKRFNFIKLYLYTKEEAIEYIKHCRPAISGYLARMIVDRVGIRQGNLTMFLRYLDNTRIPLEDYQRIKSEIETLPLNHIPALTHKVMESYRCICRELFYILFLLRGKVAENLLGRLGISLVYADKLVEEDILVYHNEWYVCANPVVWSVVED